MFRTLKIGTTAALVATTALLTSCLEAPNYPAEPRIEFKELKVTRYTPGGGITPSDTVAITVDFTDGDGDLGLSILGDKEAPFNASNPDGTYNRSTHNYFITAYRRPNAQAAFEPYESGSPQGYNSRFPLLFNPEAKPGPLKGTLTLTLGLFLGQPFYPGEEVRFDVSIMDRALHESNRVTTTSYIVKPL